MTGVTRRLVIKGGLSLATMGLLSGCRAVSLPGQPASRGPKVPRIGYLALTNADAANLEAFRDGLRDLGYVEGQNVVIDVRLAESTDQFRALAVELLELPADVIVSAGGTPATQAVMGATRTIPIVFTAAGDPVQSGFVNSLARPGGNVTGLSNQGIQVQGKRLQLLREIVPGISRVMFLTDTVATQATTGGSHELQDAAQLLRLELLMPNIDNATDLQAAFHLAVMDHAGALLVSGAALMFAERERIVQFASAARLPVVSQSRPFSAAGGLMSYGPNLLDLYRRAATYADTILKGTKPAELPVEQPTEFDFIINLKTSQMLGITVPASVLARATEIIQ